MANDPLSDIPDEHHFAILTSQSVSVPNPAGNRLGDYDDPTLYAGTFLKYEVFPDRDEWEARIRELTVLRWQFKAIDVIPATITQHISITPRSRKP
jgi:hypothetical protein